MQRKRTKPPVYNGYYKALETKKNRNLENSSNSSFFLTQTSEEFKVWKKQDEVPETIKKKTQSSEREKKAEEYYKDIPLKPGLGSILAMTRFRTIKRRNNVNNFLLPPTILVAGERFVWLKSDPKTGNVEVRDLSERTGTVSDDMWTKEFAATCATFRRSPNIRAPPYVAVRRTFFEGNPERSRTVVAGPAALLGHLQKLAFDRRHHDPSRPTTRPEPSIEIWQPLIWGRGM